MVCGQASRFPRGLALTAVLLLQEHFAHVAGEHEAKELGVEGKKTEALPPPSAWPGSVGREGAGRARMNTKP